MHEINLRVIIIGLLLSVIMGSANVYLGLKAGMTVSASIPAAVLGMLILRFIRKRNKESDDGFVLEANQIQTSASAGESLAAGIIFTMPALIIIGAWESFNMTLTTLIAFTGGLLGILFMIPMRQVFIVSNDHNLKYPEGLACASVLDVGKDEGSQNKAMHIINGTLIGGLFKALISYAGILKDILESAFINSNRVFYFGGDISPALIAVGYIVRLNVAVLIFIGGFLGWLIGIPILSYGLEYNSTPLDYAWNLWSTEIRYVGVGTMVIGGVASIFKVRRGLVDAIIILFNNKNTNKSNLSDKERNISSKAINILSIMTIILIFSIYFYITTNITIAIATTFIMIIMAFFFTAVASYIVGLVGNSNSPVSGMTITTVLFTGGILYIFGFSGTEGMIATLGVAAIVCCAACTSGDVCNDLKTGQIVGASPYKQQIMQIMGVAIASLIMAPILQLLHENTPGGIGGKQLSAPQAGLFASLVNGFFGNGNIPWDMIEIGIVIGLLILVIDALLEYKNYNFRLHLMPIAVGIYLPFGLSTPILAGGLISYFIQNKKKHRLNPEKTIDSGILLSSGLIAGESLMGLLLAFLASLGINNLNLGISSELSNVLTLFSILFIISWLFYNAKEN